MAQVKAKTAVYLGSDGGYRTEGEVFDYAGPENRNLEYLDKVDDDSGDGSGLAGPYDELSRDELKALLGERVIEFAPNCKDQKLRLLLEKDDEAKKGS